ncbi:MAG: transglycosylase SLT domain-containing protein [Alphaproteobacteria bacterium]|nr:transglycosylase SLT domain-containing protein [Alphaproteobacteria bacterium]MDE2266795.1 transglycosylase SLT domain-containing protein [Alphaproteobacteria bacterium]MDE2498630.1 transglycosylase SLT domain-containing protein [Alphaproteobacteria bacterium]
MAAEALSILNDKSTVVAALQRASAVTGSDFNYLLDTAMRESGLKPHAQSNSSSAAGLFQFVEQTWLGLVKSYGTKFGLGSYAGVISQGRDGHYHVNNPSDRQAILALRNNPQVSAMMAGEYAQQTKTQMQDALGRTVCGGELYAAHFLGADAACRLIRMNGSTPQATAAAVFPQAADANKSVFYHSDGTPKTVREVYDWALGQPSPTVSQPSAGPAVASATPSAPSGYSDLFASMWSPSSATGFFSSGGAGFGASPFLLTPGILDILSSFSPVAKKPDAS